jgi:hypothetical protein
MPIIHPGRCRCRYAKTVQKAVLTPLFAAQRQSKHDGSRIEMLSIRATRVVVLSSIRVPSTTLLAFSMDTNPPITPLKDYQFTSLLPSNVFNVRRRPAAPSLTPSLPGS